MGYRAQNRARKSAENGREGVNPTSLETLRRSIGLEEKETLDHAYEQMRARTDLDLIPPDAAVDNLIKMMTYVDKRAATVDKSKLSDYAIVRELIQTRAVPAKK